MECYIYVQVSFPINPEAVPVYVHGPSIGDTPRVAIARAIRMLRSSRAAYRERGGSDYPTKITPIAALPQALSERFDPKALISLAKTGLEK